MAKTSIAILKSTVAEYSKKTKEVILFKYRSS